MLKHCFSWRPDLKPVIQECIAWRKGSDGNPELQNTALTNNSTIELQSNASQLLQQDPTPLDPAGSEDALFV